MQVAALLFSEHKNKINKYSFIKTSDKPQMNTTATTGISDPGAAPVGTNYNVYR